MAILLKATKILCFFAAFIPFGVVNAQENSTPEVLESVATGWQAEQIRRKQAHKAYLESHKVDYDWFSKFAFSQSDGIPFIILKLLPIIAPEEWGSKENFLDVVGLFKDERDPNYPIAAGIGISVFNRGAGEGNPIDYTSVTCGSCHNGRVKGANNEFVYLDGGVNAEFNIVQLKRRISNSLETILEGVSGEAARREKALEVFLGALDTASAENPNYFYQNYRYQGRILDADYEKSQIAVFKSQAPELIDKFINKVERDTEGLNVLLNQSYKGLDEVFWAGFPGMADATGISTTNAYAYVEGSFYKFLAWWFILPPTPGITDFMAVWEQDRRIVGWDETKTHLQGGGGQWNGNIPLPIYRNLAAQLTSGLSDNDIRVGVYSTNLLAGLPAPVYPFDVDMALAAKGEGLFQENCAGCHQDKNGKVYENIGTSLNRSQIVSTTIRDAGTSRLAGVCSPTTEVKFYGESVRPCAEFKGVSLVGREDLIMTAPESQLGYNALPLGGIWAQAPYLHNGSIPTLYHLLVPESRPEKFVKSRLTYDTEKGGFSWELPLEGDKNAAAYIMDTTAIPSFSNNGHDTDIVEGDKTYKLDWSQDIEGAKALIEYLKTL